MSDTEAEVNKELDTGPGSALLHDSDMVYSCIRALLTQQKGCIKTAQGQAPFQLPSAPFSSLQKGHGE